MTIEQFIEQNRTALCKVIARALNHVPSTASCSCPRSGTEHYHDDYDIFTYDELEQWISNDEGLYMWARDEGVEDE